MKGRNKKRSAGGSRWEKSFGIASPGVVALGARFTSDKEELVKGVISTPGGKQWQGNHPAINTGRAGFHPHCLQLGPSV